ncbi:PH domain-containing protein [Polaromonas sp.]|nr:PH domain-containing protein [Candidatus Saccharibacteria bacterium]
MNPTSPNPSQPQPADPANLPPQVVYVSRPLQPAKPVISDETRQKHEESKKKYPQLNLSEGEYIISAVSRHPFGLLQIWFISIFVTVVLVTLIALLLSDPGGSISGLGEGGGLLRLLSLPLLLGVILSLAGGAIGTFVFQANTFYLTNESVIQNVQSSLFKKRLQTVSLGNIEDASFTQNGIIPHALNYGSIRLSTEGDETTYHFNYASQPEKQIALLNNAVEAFKAGRPVEG